MDEENQRTKITPDVVVLIHGTGAGTRNTENPHWWQANSNFAQKLLATLGGEVVIDDSFTWGNGGANSESARRKAGRQLLEKLKSYEARAIPYHLVGHSHGGSVIWHALTQSAAWSLRFGQYSARVRDTRQLKYLRS